MRRTSTGTVTGSAVSDHEPPNPLRARDSAASTDWLQRRWASLRAQSAGVQAAVWIFALPVAIVLWSVTRRRGRGATAVIGTVVAVLVAVAPLGFGSTNTDDDVALHADRSPTTAAPTTGTSSTAPSTAAPTTPAPTTAPAPTTVPTPPPTTAPPPTNPPSSAAPAPTDRRATAEALMLQLVVQPESAASGYDRDLFPHWHDDDRNGCNTRCEVLARQELPGGGWYSMYDRTFVANSSDLDVDHVVPLAEAWRSGASGWPEARRRDFANDLGPHALVAVTASSNRSKGDRDPSSWVPDHPDDWCDYAIWWATVKSRWQLTADQQEVSALRRLVDTC